MLDHPKEMADMFGLSELLFPSEEPLVLEDEAEGAKKVTSQDILKETRKIFVPKNLNLVVIGSLGKKSNKKWKIL